MKERFKRAVKKRMVRQLLVWWLLPFVVVGGWRYPVLGYFIPLCMLAGMGIALFKGRYWCDWLCPRGSSFDLFLSRISVGKKIPRFLRTTLFRVLVLMILMTILFTQLPRVWPSIEGMGRVFVIMLSVTTTVGIIAGILTHQRNWCTYCPVGTIGNWFGRGKYPLIIDSACTMCKRCDAVCPIQIKRWEYRPQHGASAVIPEWDCLKCGLCIERCPQKALAFRTKEKGNHAENL
jgi:ferredoxin-type protein NapH